MEFSPDGRTAVYVGRDIAIWDLTSGKKAWAVRSHSITGISSTAFSLDGRTLATGETGIITIWNLDTIRNFTCGRGHSYAGSGDALAFSADGLWLASADRV